MAVARTARLFVDVGAKHRVFLEPSPANKKQFVMKGRGMGMSIIVSPHMGIVEVRYGMHMPVEEGKKTAWRFRPSCFEDVERHVLSGKTDTVFECGSFKGDVKEAMKAFESLCKVFDSF